MVKKADSCENNKDYLKTKNYDLGTVIPRIKYCIKRLKVKQPFSQVAADHCDLHIQFEAMPRTQDSGDLPNPETCETEVLEREEAQSLAHMGPVPVVFVPCSVCRYNSDETNRMIEPDAFLFAEHDSISVE